MRSIRVHDVARELGVTSREVIKKCSEYGEFVKSASSELPPRLVHRLRGDFDAAKDGIDHGDYGNAVRSGRPADTDDGGFADAYKRAQRASRSRMRKQSPAEIESAIYRYVIDPNRTRQGAYTPEERDRAERLTQRWAGTWLPELAEWIAVSGGENADLAARFSQAGLMAADVGLRIGFGRIDLSRDTIFERVANGTLGFKDAVRQVTDFRLSESASG